MARTARWPELTTIQWVDIRVVAKESLTEIPMRMHMANTSAGRLASTKEAADLMQSERERVNEQEPERPEQNHAGDPLKRGTLQKRARTRLEAQQ